MNQSIIPAYTAAKMLANMSKDVPLLGSLFAAADLDKARSKPSFEEVKQGFAGLSEGISRRTARGHAAARAMFK